MAAKLRESFDSRTPSDDNKSGRKCPYRALITGAKNEVVADNLAVAEMPNVIISGGQTLTRLNYSLKNEGAGVFRLEAEYGVDSEPQQNNDGPGNDGGQQNPKGDNDPLGPEWNLSLAENQTHITQSLKTLNSYAKIPFLLPDFKKAIGVTREKIEGCDIVSPKETRSYTTRVAGMSANYLKSLKGIFGHTNSHPMMGCAVGEVLYVGYTSQYRAKELWSLTHNFWIGENLEWPADYTPGVNAAADEMAKRLTIGNIQLINGKRAWSYLWVSYLPSKDVVTGLTVEVPLYVFEEQVYPSGNLKILGI